MKVPGQDRVTGWADKTFQLTVPDKLAIHRGAKATKVGVVACLGTSLATKGSIIPDPELVYSTLAAAAGLGYGKRTREQKRELLYSDPPKEDQ